jgi:regulatory subunit for Cdc7p protein kinase
LLISELGDILDRLAPVGQPTVQNNSLSTLLQDEKIHGTRERDANAPRPDWYYFRTGSKYLLVEDATSKHRTVLVKEYQAQGKAAPEYPILYETFLKPSASAETDVPLHEIRKRAWSLYVDQVPWKGEPVPASIQQSTSLKPVVGTPSAPDVQPYHQASGNSVVITSNINSTSTANHSPAFGTNGLPALGANKDRAIMQMSKRVQVLKGNAAARARLGPAITPHHDLLVNRRNSTASTSTSLQDRTFLNRQQVVAMLRKQREPAPEDAMVTIERRIRNRERVEAGIKGVKEQDTSSGYCENCRIRYEDLSSVSRIRSVSTGADEQHLVSRKHRRFAQNPANFADLDSLLKLLRRQINPNFTQTEIPFAPCWNDHRKDDPCPRCVLTTDADDEDATPEATSGGIDEWVVEEDSPASISSQGEDEGIINEHGEDIDEEEGGFFEESAEGKEFEQ